MSIDIDQFDERSPEELAELSNPEHVLRFLYENRDRAWKAKEIASRTPVPENSIHPVLSRLAKQELVRHKAPYWALTDNLDRLRQAYDHHRVTRLFDDCYGEEDRDEWIKASEQAER